jgi:hypothetical protein
MTITIERLKEIAETEFEDVEVLISAVREMAMGLVQVMETASRPAAAPERLKPIGRPPGKPIPSGVACTTCSRCGDGIAMFVSKKTGKPYKCDTTMGEHQNKRQLLSHQTWFHECGGGR